MERQFKVKPVGIKYICDKCKEGEMNQTGQMQMYDDYATFIHKCSHCEHKLELKEKYPLIRYKQI